MTENELPLITSSCGCSDASCGCTSTAAQAEHVHATAGGCCGGHEGHAHDEQADPSVAAFEAMFTEVAYAMHEQFGEQGPTAEQEKEFMREWLIGKGRSVEEVDAILNTETQDA